MILNRSKTASKISVIFVDFKISEKLKFNILNCGQFVSARPRRECVARCMGHTLCSSAVKLAAGMRTKVGRIKKILVGEKPRFWNPPLYLWSCFSPICLRIWAGSHRLFALHAGLEIYDIWTIGIEQRTPNKLATTVSSNYTGAFALKVFQRRFSRLFIFGDGEFLWQDTEKS